MALAASPLSLGIAPNASPSLDNKAETLQQGLTTGDREIVLRPFATIDEVIVWFRRYHMLDLAILRFGEGIDPLVGDYVVVGPLPEEMQDGDKGQLLIVGRQDLPEADLLALQQALADFSRQARVPTVDIQNTQAVAVGRAFADTAAVPEAVMSAPPAQFAPAQSVTTPAASPIFQVVARNGHAVAPPLSATPLNPELASPSPATSLQLSAPEQSSPPSRPTASPPLPLDSPLYGNLEKLAAMGWIDGGLHGNRPYTRGEAARLTAEAVQRLGRQPAPYGVTLELIAELRQELTEELTEYGVGPSELSGSYLRPVREVVLRQLFRDGPDSLFPGPGMEAGQFALDVNRNGRPLGPDGRMELTLAGDARLGQSLLLYWRPMLYMEEGGDDDDIELRLDEGAVSLDIGPLALSAGRQALWWGHGRRGSLLLTNNARPLDMVRLTNPSPALLPGFLRWLGPCRFDFFLSRLEENRVVSEPYLSGLRIDLKPLPWLELGVARTAIIGGDGRPDPEWSDLFPFLSGDNLMPNEDNSNALASVDALLRLPLMGGVDLYGEFGGEDESGGLFSRFAWITGMYLPAIGPEGRGSLRLEYVDLSRNQENFSGWYRHAVYQSGYTYHELIMGHHAGSPSREFSAEVEARFNADWLMKVGFANQKRGYGSPVQEEHLQGWMELSWRFDPIWLMSVAYAQDEISNADYIDGRDERGRLATLSLSGRF